MSLDKIKELSDIILENKNSEKENKVFIDKINKKYEFEEYIPQHNNISNNEDFYVLTEMNKYTGFNIEESFSDPKIKKEIKFILCPPNHTLQNRHIIIIAKKRLIIPIKKQERLSIKQKPNQIQ